MQNNQKNLSPSHRETMRTGNSNEVDARTRRLRHNAIDPEQLLWNRLRDRQLGGFKFRRQLRVPPYIVDFICFGRKLIVEIDGGQHDGQRRDDDARTQFLEGKGYRLIRFWNHDVLLKTEAVLEVILKVLAERSGK